MHGEVHTWKMTEEERIAYIKKHPIVPIEKSKGSTFILPISEERKKQAYENQLKTRMEKGLLNQVDEKQVHKMFMASTRVADMANAVGVSESWMHNYIKEHRKADPEQWPKRNRGGKRK